MIVFEDRVAELIDLIPMIDGFKTHFYWGKDGKDVNQYLRQTTDPYPLVYLTRGIEKSKGLFNEVERNCTFILACPERDDSKLNDERLKSSYKNYLNPLASYMIELFDTSSISRLPNGYRLQRIPSYSEAEKHPQIDKWDVIVLECDLIITDKCLKPVKWQ